MRVGAAGRARPAGHHLGDVLPRVLEMCLETPVTEPAEIFEQNGDVGQNAPELVPDLLPWLWLWLRLWNRVLGHSLPLRRFGNASVGSLARWACVIGHMCDRKGASGRYFRQPAH